MKDKLIKIKPPLYALLYLIIGYLLHKKFQLIIIEEPYNKIGLLLIILGFSVMIFAALIFKKLDTTILPTEKPKKLVLTGPYKLTRNPIYTGIITILAGFFIFVGDLLMLIGPLLFFITVNNIHIPFEEKNLESAFGKKYMDYKKKVRRWI